MTQKTNHKPTTNPKNDASNLLSFGFPKGASDMDLFCEKFPTVYVNMFYENLFLNACCKFLSNMKIQHPEWFKEHAQNENR